jgi:rod shape-determining protein MreC
VPRREAGRSRLAVIILCVLAGVALGVWHSRAAARERSDPLTSAVRTVTVPLVRAVAGTTRWANRQIGWLFHGRTLADENRRLRQEVAGLQEEVARLREAEITSERLRAQLGFGLRPPGAKLAADVVTLRPSPHFETMVVSRGTADGVHVGTVVVAPAGLVGHVYDVAPSSAAVLLLTDGNAAVGARVQRAQSRATGVCKGSGGPSLSMAYLDRDADVRVGDTIVSSGLGGEKAVFPKGLVIGTVTSVADDPTGSTRRVAIKPAVSFSRLEEVYLLR